MCSGCGVSGIGGVVVIDGLIEYVVGVVWGGCGLE